MYVEYRNEDGKKIDNPIEIIKIEVSALCYEYIEKNEGKKPSNDMINSWVKDFTKKLIGD